MKSSVLTKLASRIMVPVAGVATALTTGTAQPAIANEVLYPEPTPVVVVVKNDDGDYLHRGSGR